MAWEYVGGTTGTGTATGYAVSLNGTLTGGIASSPAPGDLVVVMSAFGNTAASAPAITGNNSGAYTGIGTAIHANDTWDTEVRPFYKVMGATPDTSLSVTRTNSAVYGGATVVQVWRGVDTASPFIGTTQTSGTNGCVINPPAYNPAVADALIIAGGAGTMAATSSAYTAFSGMSNFITAKGDGSTSDTAAAMASFLYAGASYDPPAVSGGTTSTSSSWGGFTFAFRMFVPAATELLGENSAQSNTSTTGAISSEHSLSGAESSVSHTSTADNITQTHTLAGNGAAQQNTSSAGAIQVATDTNLSGNNAAQASTSTAGSITQTHTLAGNAASQANNATTGSISQSHSLTGNNATQRNTSASSSISQTHALTGNAASQPNTSTTGSISTDNTVTLIGSNASQSNTSTTGPAQQTNQLAGNNAAQSNTSTSAGISVETVEHNLTASDGASSNTSTAASITQSHQLTGDWVRPGWVEEGFVLNSSANQPATSTAGAIYFGPVIVFTRAPAGAGPGTRQNSSTRPANASGQRTTNTIGTRPANASGQRTTNTIGTRPANASGQRN